MPRIKIDYVVSFSSEDNDNKADSLLNWEVSKKKWLCNRGEPTSSVVLQLKSCTQISAVHLGVYHTALVEVLVGLSEKPNDPYEVLVPSSIFVNPIESRRNETIERVRSFTTEQLCEGARSKRWDRVRVVCSQPYNKHCQYGLSFIHIYSPDTPAITTTSSTPTVNAITIPTYSSDEDEFRPGELFALHRQSQGESSNTDAQIRQASCQAIKNISDTATKLVKTPIAKPNSKTQTQKDENPNKDRQRNTLIYTADEEQPHAKIDRIVQRHNDEKQDTSKRKESEIKDKNKDRHKTDSSSDRSHNSKTDKHGSKKKDRNNDSRRSDRDERHIKTKENEKTDRDRNNDSRRSDKDERRNKTKESEKTDRDRNTDSRRSDKDERHNKTSEKLKYTASGSKEVASSSRDVPSTSNEDGAKNSLKRTYTERKDRENDLLPGPKSSTPQTLFKNVVFAISGYENPRRANIRSTALAMGASYKQNWTPECTHLICAFANTPKLKSVRSHPDGTRCIVVTGDWVEQCSDHMRVLPWQWFATEASKKVERRWIGDEEEKRGDDEDLDTDDEIERVVQQQKRRKTDQNDNRKPDDKVRRSDTMDVDNKPNSNSRIDVKQNGNSQDVIEKKRDESSKSLNVPNDSDVTFVRDERIQGNITIQDSDGDSDATDIEEPRTLVPTPLDSSKTLPDLFEGTTFVIADNVDEDDREMIKRYVAAYGGIVNEHASATDKKADYAICTSTPVLNETCVRADWLWRCHDEQKLCDIAEYLLDD